MDYKDTVKYYEKELNLDKEDAVERAKQQGKGPKLAKKAPKRIKNKKNFIDRLVLKELEDDMNEDIILNKNKKDYDISPKDKNHNPLLLKNVKSLKSMAEKMGVSKQELIELLKNEQ